MKRHSQSQLKSGQCWIWTQFCLPPKLTHLSLHQLTALPWAPSFHLQNKGSESASSDAPPLSHCMTFMVGREKAIRMGSQALGRVGGEHLSLLTGWRTKSPHATCYPKKKKKKTGLLIFSVKPFFFLMNLHFPKQIHQHLLQRIFSCPYWVKLYQKLASKKYKR